MAAGHLLVVGSQRRCERTGACDIAITDKTAANAYVADAEVTATWVRFVATLTQATASTQTGPAAVIFDVDASMNVTDAF